MTTARPLRSAAAKETHDGAGEFGPYGGMNFFYLFTIHDGNPNSPSSAAYSG
jgi:hypothetical protein